MKYKIGQTVICIENPEGKVTSDCDGKGAGWEEGLIFKIIKIDEGVEGNNILWDGKNDCGVYTDFVRHTTWQERYKK